MAHLSLSPVVASIIIIFTGGTSGQDSNATELCQIFSNVPNYINNGVGRFDSDQMDELDMYLAETADCNYVSQKDTFTYSFSNKSFEEILESQFGVRGSPDVEVDVLWENKHYFFTIGDELVDFAKVKSYQVRERTDNLLSNDAYQLFTIRLEKNRISLSKGCDEPIVVHNVDGITRGTNVEMRVQPFGDGGAKLLYNCTGDVSGSRYDKSFSSPCERVPSSVHVETNWSELGNNQPPNMDQLDSFMIRSTGCEYRGTGRDETFLWFEGAFETLVTQRVAIRTRDTTYVHLRWQPPRTNQYIYMGVAVGSVVKPQYAKSRVILPSNLTYSSYLPIIITFDNGTLSFGRQCEESSLMMQNISIERGARIEMSFFTRNIPGGKFLYNCPGNVTIVRRPLCDPVPPAVQRSRDSWREQQTPSTDGLDTYQVNNTGCEYKALSYQDATYQFKNLTFENDTQVVLAFRADGMATVLVVWDDDNRYSFGFDDANLVFFYDSDTNEEEENTIRYNLTENSYTPVYVKFTKTTLSFGVQCDKFPAFVRDVSLPRGTRIQLAFETKSLSGGKFLYNCPQL